MAILVSLEREGRLKKYLQKPIIVGILLNVTGISLIALHLTKEWGSLLWLGVGLAVLGSILVARYLRESLSSGSSIPRTIQTVQNDVWKIEPELALQPPRRVALKPIGRWGIWLWIIALAVSLLYIGGYPRHADPATVTFSQLGTPATAVVHGKRHHKSPSGKLRYYLQYSFTDLYGKQVRVSTSVKERLYHSLVQGDTVQVIYLPGNPLSHRIHQSEDSKIRWNGFLVLLALLAILFTWELQRKRHKKLVSEGSAINGTVLEVIQGGLTPSYTISVETEGIERKVHHPEKNCGLSPGNQVTVLYHPGRPSHLLLYRAAIYRACSK